MTKASVQPHHHDEMAFFDQVQDGQGSIEALLGLYEEGSLAPLRLY